MSMTKLLKRLCCSALWATPLIWVPTTHAHPTFVPTEVLEGVTTNGMIKLTHACEESQLPVIAVSYIVPTVNPFLERSDGGKIDALSDVLQNTGLQNFIIPFYDRGLFKLHRLNQDALGNTIGFNSRNGRLPLGFPGQVPIQIGGLFFNSDSCASEIRIKVAGADICKKTSAVGVGDANLWIPNRTPRFPDGNVHGSSRRLRQGSPVTLRVKRDLTNNAIPPSCGGKTFTVTVWPSNEDIDQNLPIPGFWPTEAAGG
jgi:hypothetical protein